MAKRGRPAKSGSRHPNGELRPAPDHGTAEHQAKRRSLVGPPRDTRSSQRIQKHVALASYPLGVLYARRLVLSGDHYAGRRYAALFAHAVRPVTIPSILENLIAGGALPIAMAALDEMAGMEKHPVTGALVPVGTHDREQYLAAREALDRVGPRIAQIVDDLVIYEHTPRTQKRLDAIRDGLGALHRHFEAADERARVARTKE